MAQDTEGPSLGEFTALPDSIGESDLSIKCWPYEFLRFSVSLW